MARASRLVYAALAWLFVVGLLTQVLLIGLGLPQLGGQSSSLALHRDFGWALHLFPLLILLFAWLSRAGKRHWQWALALAVVVLVVPLLPGAGGVVAAFHPVGAMLAFALAAVVAMNSLRALRAALPDTPPQPGMGPGA